MSTVFRVQNPEVLHQQIFLDLLQRAFSARTDLFPEPDEVGIWLKENLSDPEIGLFVAVTDDSELGGLLVASIRTSVFSRLPWLLYLFSDHWTMTQQLAVACQDWVLENGFDQIYGFNTTGKDDQSFVRLADHLDCHVPTIIRFAKKDQPEPKEE